MFAIQEDIAQAIVSALKTRLDEVQERIPFKRPTENLEAYNLYLNGRYQWNKFSPEAWRTAIEYFQRAAAADPKFAAAWAGMAYAYIYSYRYGYDAPSIAKARAAAEKALAIDPTSSEALSALARIKGSYDYDWPAAGRLFQRALELNPSDSIARESYAMMYLTPLGHLDEAQIELQRAAALDPLSLGVRAPLGFIHYLMGRYDDAIEHYKNVIELGPARAVSYPQLAYAYVEESMFREAISTLEKQPTQLWEGPNLGALGYV